MASLVRVDSVSPSLEKQVWDVPGRAGNRPIPASPLVESLLAGRGGYFSGVSRLASFCTWLK